MKKSAVIIVWIAVALLTGLFWAQVAYMCGAPGWAVGAVAIITAIAAFWFGCAMIAGGDADNVAKD
jgi:hypothetical protein